LANKEGVRTFGKKLWSLGRQSGQGGDVKIARCSKKRDTSKPHKKAVGGSRIEKHWLEGKGVTQVHATVSTPEPVNG